MTRIRCRMRCSPGHPGERDGAGASLTPAAPSRTPLRRWLALCVLLSSVCGTWAQVRAPENRARFALSQNVADYLFLGTLNAGVQYSVHRAWTLQAGTRYNNWTWHEGEEDQFEWRQQTYYAGVRWWPWYTYSGWWAGARLQYKEYNHGGLLLRMAEEGDAAGLALGAGYAIHINHWLNAEFGMYGWGGTARYVIYDCPHCGKRILEGTKTFLLPDEVLLSLQFIF